MIKHITAFALSIIVLTSSFPAGVQAAEIKTNQMRVVLDPGHGGKDSGLVSTAGLTEAQEALALARMIAGELSDRFDVVLTRKTDTPDADPMDSEPRAAFANQNRADVFVSIHLSQARSDIPRIFCYDLPQPSQAGQWQSQALENKSDSQHLAQLTAGRFQSGQNLRAEIHHAPLRVMEGLLMPGILVEPFSLSQVPADPASRTSFLRPYARTLAAAVADFLARNPDPPSNSAD